MIVDTDVFSYLLKEDTRGDLYTEDLRGKSLHLTFITVAEVRYWGLNRRWGQRRMAELEQRLRYYAVLGIDDQTAWKWAAVADHERRSGRDKQDKGDWWIAACALRQGMPLVTHNAVHFAAIPNLELITRAPGNA